MLYVIKVNNQYHTSHPRCVQDGMNLDEFRSGLAGYCNYGVKQEWYRSKIRSLVKVSSSDKTETMEHISHETFTRKLEWLGLPHCHL